MTLLAIGLLQEGNPENEAIMIEPKIMVSEATGKTGSVVVAELLKAGYLRPNHRSNPL